jgi:hypothetical protein
MKKEERSKFQLKIKKRRKQAPSRGKIETIVKIFSPLFQL